VTTHKTGTREAWLKTRLELLKAGKELTHGSDESAHQRQELPWAPINKGHGFDTDEGSASPPGLFRGHSQLLMFGPDFAAGCPSCSSIANGFNGIAVHLGNHDVMLGSVSRALSARGATAEARVEKGPRCRARLPMDLRRSRLCAEWTRRCTFARGRA
jgi:predicted dithiol-disulfide oxidoreductase (DUF899 family)